MPPVVTELRTPTTPDPALHTRSDDISALAAQAISPAVATQLRRYGFEVSSMVARDSSASSNEDHAADPIVGLISIARPSLVPDELAARNISLQGLHAEFRISLVVSRGHRGETSSQPEATWSIPQTESTASPYARAHCSDDGRWEYNMSKEARPLLRAEVNSLPREFWQALFQALEEVSAAYERAWTSPRPSSTDYYTSLAAAIPGIFPPWGLPY